MTLILASLIFSAALTWLMVRIYWPIAEKIGLVDNPDKTRKLHQTAIPLVGGISVCTAISIVIPIMLYVGHSASTFFTACDQAINGILPWELPTTSVGHIRRVDLKELVGLLIAGVFLLGVGVLDDWKGIRGRHKLIGQFIAATILMLFGYQFEGVQFAGFEIKFGVFAGILIYMWILAAINSVNLLDGADGIASTIGIIMSGSMGVMMLFQGKGIDSVVMFSITGALIAFLTFNFPPAKVYLGDAGSMLIGFLLAAMAIRSTFKQSSLFAFMAPVALLAIPFIDTGAAIIRRRLTGRSVFSVDRGHLHHALLEKGYSPVASLVWVALFCLITAVGGVMALLQRDSEIALASIGLVIIMMAGARLFGFAEIKLVSRKAYGLGRSMLRGGRNSAQPKQIKESTFHVQGDRDWTACWNALCDYAKQNNFIDMTMDLNAPWIHEAFHAKMQGTEKVRESNYVWSSSVPLVFRDRIFGKIDFSCSKDSRSHHEIIADILNITRAIEESLDEETPLDDAPESNNKLEAALSDSSET
ncbi:MraY family glycosyltransferase [Mariniblastus fucicola]|uniref:Putative undecaprenyl-phosphate N-acetylglucosaminyl 1-phosphate transferase n=1 Tax=Mariniblastus fucicola TaxID=980251 RepID=A0A5B9PBU0_9BACT|nr:MraY family glycosyltransferase [Mariniblastus fucicola]QEG23788.1 putative undecaprenyl-phosphate N-acetylglucosaminyl 1-phosphate transferase [Mariniblastus fucicola]